jgi:predicted ATP-dependent endonuclease of OLD family
LFKEDPSISIPLRNLFHLYGKTDNEQIKQTIERALKDQARRDELQNKMSSDITKHVNKIWQEHKIKIRVSINGSDCQVHVEDRDKEFAYYKMNQRSDGFKQFISLILSLSTQNASKSLKNCIILIDEPEVHLHPSGVRYMRDEILKIGKNNSIFVATHSHYMVDTLCPERHWIVTKNKTMTSISQISEETSIEDDAVLASAFGLNLFKELLPRHIIVVEGLDDKSIFSHAINRLDNKLFCSIKVAKGASKAYSIAALLADEKISAFFLFDDDKEGRDYKGRIIENYSKSFSTKNVFTLYDVYNKLPQKCTIEDLFPISFVKSFFEKELKKSFTIIPLN